MLQMLQNIGISCGSIGNIAGIQNHFKCCRIMIRLVNFQEHQILEMLLGFETVVNVAEYCYVLWILERMKYCKCCRD